jgi:hypothetical protein
MPHVQAPLARAVHYTWTDIRYLLTDAVQHTPVAEGQNWKLVWQNAKYRLWDAGSANWAIVTDAQVPNGIERLNGKPFFWLGGGPTTLQVSARDAGCVQASAIMTPGPSVRSSTFRKITIVSSGGTTESLSFAPGRNRFGWFVRTGTNRVDLRPDDEPDGPRQGADRRPLVAGLGEMAILAIGGVRSPPTSARIEGVTNPNGIEQLDGQPFFWLGAGPATVRISSESLVSTRLQAELFLGPSVASSVSTRRLRIRASGHATFREAEVGAGDWVEPITLRPGETIVQLDTAPPAVLRPQTNGDRRPLVLGVRNLRLEADSVWNCR